MGAGMPGGRELGVIIGAALGRKGTEAPRSISGGERRWFDVQRRIPGSGVRTSCTMQTPNVYLLICPCLHMYTIRLKSKFEE